LLNLGMFSQCSLRRFLSRVLLRTSRWIYATQVTRATNSINASNKSVNPFSSRTPDDLHSLDTIHRMNSRDICPLIGLLLKQAYIQATSYSCIGDKTHLFFGEIFDSSSKNNVDVYFQFFSYTSLMHHGSTNLGTSLKKWKSLFRLYILPLDVTHWEFFMWVSKILCLICHNFVLPHNKCRRTENSLGISLRYSLTISISQYLSPNGNLFLRFLREKVIPLSGISLNANDNPIQNNRRISIQI